MNTSESIAKTLVIGIGNRYRGDDAIGPLVVDAIRRAASSGRQEIETIVTDGDLSDLALRWQADNDVIIVDACRSGRPPGTIQVVDGLTTTIETGPYPVSSHGIGLAEAIELGRLLGRLPRSLAIFAVEAATFDHFAPLSEPVAVALTEVATEVTLRLSNF